MQVDGDIATVGITAYAAEQLGDVVFVELPEIGAQGEEGRRRRGGGIGEGGERRLQPGLRRGRRRRTRRSPTIRSTVNEAPEGGGWFVKLKLADQERARRPHGRGGLPRLRGDALRRHGARISRRRSPGGADGEDFAKGRYSRAHEWRFDGGIDGAGLVLALASCRCPSRARTRSIRRRPSSPRSRAATC